MAAGVKAPPGSPVAARRGDKPISSASAAVIAVAVAEHAPQAGVDYFKMAAAQQQCEESLQLAASPSLQVQRRQVRGVELLYDVSTALVWPIVPAACRREVFTAMHYLAHPGIRATRRMVTQDGYSALHLEGVRSRCSQMVQRLSGLPEREDNTTAHRRCAADSSPSPPVFTSSCGLGGPAAFFA